MNPMQIFAIASTPTYFKKETQTDMHSLCPSMESKKHLFAFSFVFLCFVQYFSL